MSESVDDSKLAVRAQQGDLDAFDQLVEAYQRRLFCFLRFHGAGAADVEDIVQEAFLRAFANIGQFNPQWRFSTWLFTIARRLLPSRRGAALALHNDFESLPSRETDPHHQAIEFEERSMLWERIRQHSSDDEFQLLWFYYAERLSLVEIARIMGDSHAACKTRLSRLRKRLRSRLEPFVSGQRDQFDNEQINKQQPPQLAAARRAG